MKEKTIRVLKIEPGKYPKETTLTNSLESLQKAVGGLIEIIGMESQVCLLCNEEGKIRSLPGNRSLGYDIIAGTFYITGCDENGNLCSLPTDMMEKYEVMFYEPETFTKEEVESKLFFEFINLD